LGTQWASAAGSGNGQKWPGGGCKSANLVSGIHPFFFERLIMSNTRQAIVDSQERLVSAIRSEISDAEELLSATADQVGEKIARLRERIQSRLREAKLRLAEAEALLVDKTRAAARATDDYVHESPWTAIGIAAGVGLLVGLALGRR
jgi:ElaB/YqjD/DUF883 family membrane-anchored ribosome-binding protein